MSLSASYAISAIFSGKDKLSPVVSKIEKKYGSMAGGVARSMGKLNSAVNSMAKVGFAAAVAVTVGLTRETIAFAKAGDEAAKTSRRIGMSAEAFQELKFAADRSGVSGEETTKSFEKLNKNIGDLRAGTGSLKTILDKSNPALAEQLKNAKSNEEAFNLITGAVNKLPNQMDKAALAQAAFGRSGLKMLTVMENGTEGINKLRTEARKYGGIISNDAAKNSEAFIDAMTNMKAVLTGLKYKALTPLMNAVGPLIQSFSDYMAVNKAIIGMKIEAAFKALANAIKNIDFKALANSIKETFNMLLKVNSFIQKIGGWGTVGTIILSLVAAIKIFNVVMTVSNAIMSANPVSLIIIGFAAMIAIIIVCSKKYEEFGAAVLFVLSMFNPMLGAIYIAVAAINELRLQWDSITASFKEGGFINGMKTLGAVILQFVLRPIQQVLQLLEKIPGIAKLGLSDKLGGLMDANQNFIDRDNKEVQTQKRAQEIQNRYTLAPNGQRAETEQTKAVLGAGTITVKAEEGTSVTVDSGSMRKTGWDMKDLGKDGI